MPEFPELSSFGTLLRFAIALEEAGADLATRAAKQCSEWRDDLEGCAKKHAKRGTKLERLRRERLNEVVLQAITGMERRTYVPDLDLPGEPQQAIALVAALEEKATRFYEDAAEKAADVLTGVDKTFKKMARESSELAQSLKARVL